MKLLGFEIKILVVPVIERIRSILSQVSLLFDTKLVSEKIEPSLILLNLDSLKTPPVENDADGLTLASGPVERVVAIHFPDHQSSVRSQIIPMPNVLPATDGVHIMLQIEIRQCAHMLVLLEAEMKVALVLVTQ